MAALGVRETDIEESFVRSGGHGGQNVNKVATCVMLLHRPSGVQVECQDTRQQGLNRFLARKLLLDKIESMRKERVAAKRARLKGRAAKNSAAAAVRRNACSLTTPASPPKKNSATEFRRSEQSLEAHNAFSDFEYRAQ
jgi:protein subunit release factor B